MVAIVCWSSYTALPAAAQQAVSESHRLSIRVDSNRDGKLDASDDRLIRTTKGKFSWNRGGAFVLANIDDDDTDGHPDANDEILNGPKDRHDLADLEIPWDKGNSTRTRTVGAVLVKLSWTSSGANPTDQDNPIRVFLCTEGRCRKVDNPAVLQLQPGQKQSLALEAQRLALQNRDERVTL